MKTFSFRQSKGPGVYKNRINMFHLALMMFFSHIHLKVSLHGKSAPADESVKTQFSLPWPLGSTDPQKLKKKDKC